MSSEEKNCNELHFKHMNENQQAVAIEKDVRDAIASVNQYNASIKKESVC